VEIKRAIRKDGSIRSAVDEVTSGNAQFGIGQLNRPEIESFFLSLDLPFFSSFL
jgi:hypothetical protein